MSAIDKVYVVDDEPEVRKALERLLRAAGLQVEAKASAEEFLQASEGVPSGCVVLDYQMPGVTGLDLQEVLGALGRNWQIVFLSGHGDVPKTVQAMKAGAVDFLVKPADGAQLLGAVRRALERGSPDRCRARLARGDQRPRRPAQSRVSAR